MHFSQLDNTAITIIVIIIVLVAVYVILWWRERHQKPKKWREHVCSTLSSFELAPLQDLPPTVVSTGLDYYVLDTEKSYLVALSNKQTRLESSELIELPKDSTSIVDTLEHPSCRIVENFYQEIEIDRFGKEHRKTTPKEIRYVIYVPLQSVCTA